MIFYFILFALELNNVFSYECSSSDNNQDYMGSLNFTSSNEPCQSWSRFYDFHQGLYTLDFVDSLEDARNFCRNPSGSLRKERAWCFTNIELMTWDYCDIPKCTGCSKIHGILHGSLRIANLAVNQDESYKPGVRIKFSCDDRFAVYDSYSGPLDWVCTQDGKWSATKLPRCLWRGFLQDSNPNCWYYSQTSFYPDATPRRLYYGNTNQNIDGIRCLNWANADQYTDKDFPQEGKLMAQNFCRSPDNYEPKCFINNYRDLTSCNVPKCDGCAAIPFIKYTSFSINLNSNLEEKTAREGSEIIFRCSAGDLIGPSSLICKNGSWGNELPTCSVKFCSNPPTLENARVTYKKFTYANIEDYGKEYLTFDQSIYIFRCQEPYTFEDDAVSQVTFECISGEWNLNGKYSNCVIKTEGQTTESPFGLYCPAPTGIQNGYIKTSSIRKLGPNQFDGQFEISCYQGFKLVGNPIVRCINGQWSSYPTCSSQSSCSFDIINIPAENVRIVSSQLLYSPDNSGIAVGSYVQYECLPNYYPEFSKNDLRATCLENGQWSTKIPVRCVF